MPSRDPAALELEGPVRATHYRGAENAPRRGYVKDKRARRGYAEGWTAIIDHVGGAEAQTSRDLLPF